MKLKNLLKQTFLYKCYSWYKKKKRKERLRVLSENFLKEGEYILREFANALNAANIPFWLDYGTLLGFYREHDFIKHDSDLDTGAFIEDEPRIKETLEKAGFRLVRRYWNLDGSGLEQCYCKNGCVTTIDIFYYIKQADTIYCYSYKPLNNFITRKNLFKEMPFIACTCTMPFCGLKKAVFKNIEVNVPIDTRGYLIANYGDNFMIPDPNYSSSSATNIHYYTYQEKPAAGYLEIPYS